MCGQSSVATSPPITYYNDDKIPGRPLTKTPWAGNVASRTDPHDVYSIALQGGQNYVFRVTRHSGWGTLRFRIFGPGSQSISTQTPIASLADAETGVLGVTTPIAGGTYYLVVDAVSGGGDYRLWGTHTTDMAPGTTLPNAEEKNAVYNETGSGAAASDSVNVYRVRLLAGHRYIFSATRTAGSGTFLLSLFSPGTVDVVGTTPLIGRSSKTVASAMLVPPTTGYYVLSVRYTSGSGSYRLGLPGSPFGLDVFGYSFKNFHGTASQAVFRKTFALAYGPLHPEAQVYYNDVYSLAFGGGQCYGMAVTAGMFYRNVFGPDPSDFSSGATYTRELTRATTGQGANDVDEPIEQHISKYYYYQCDPVIPTTFTPFDASTFSVGADKVMGQLVWGWFDPLILGFGGDGWGHAVNITGLRSDYTASTGQFSIYDNNRTQGYRWWSSEPTQSGSTFSSQDYQGVKYAVVHRVSPNEKTSMPQLWETDGSAYAISTAVPKASVMILHRDAAGRRLGQLGARELAEIPGAYRVRLLTGNLDPAWKEPVQYYLPKARDYRVEFSRSSAGPLRYDLFGKAGLARVDIARVNSNVASQVRTLNGSRGFSFSTDATTPLAVTLRMYRQPSKKVTRVFAFSGLAVPASAVVTITTSTSGSEAYVRTNGPAQTYRLRLTGFDGAKASSAAVTATMPTGVTQTIKVWDWKRVQTAPVFVIDRLPSGQERIVAYQARQMTRRLS